MSTTPEFDRIFTGVLEDAVVLGGQGGYTIEPSGAPLTVALPDEMPVVRDIGQVFNLPAFNTWREPLIIGDGNLSKVPIGTRINSLPLKFPGTEYRVPEELRHIEGLLSKCVDVEAQLNPAPEDYYAYLSLQRTEVSQGRVQRSTELHCDGVQGPRVHPKVAVEHGFVLVDGAPPNFYPEAVDLSDLDPDKHDLIAAFEQRVNRKVSVVVPVGALALIDGFCLHEATPVTQSGPRGFFRILFSQRMCDRTGNTVNELFKEEYETMGWRFEPRPRPSELVAPPPLV